MPAATGPDPLLGVLLDGRYRLDALIARGGMAAVYVATDTRLDRSVFAGEAQGRWLWLVLRPASAMLLLADEWILADVSGFGAQLLETPFGGNPPAW